jgi:hypothetical protein
MKLPKEVFIKIEKPDNDDEYLGAYESLRGIVEIEEKARIGVYKLVRTLTAEGVVDIDDIVDEKK